jgi:hydroxymethylglutaryl-CoA reductase (NADPH)
MADKLPPIPRSRGEDDWSLPAVEARRDAWERAAGARPRHVLGEPVPLESARGKVENLVGFAQVPLGIAGPLLLDTSQGRREVYVPMATTEGALVASYSRGMRLLAAGGGARARVVGEGLTQNPVLVYPDAARAQAAAELALQRFDELAAIVRRTTSHGALVAIRPEAIGRRLVLALVFRTGDAIGVNMAARAADLVSAELAARTDALERYVHGQDVEKRANARALVEGRGRRAVADVTIPRAALESLARTTPEKMAACLRTYAVGYAQLGTQNWTVQSANGLAAVFLACGQDVAYVTESATGLLDLDLTPAGDLYASVHLPALLVGTVGGGTGQGTAAECLDLLGCRGAGRANLFAEILAATVLAGDLSLVAAFTSHEFVAAHERLGRNRPGGPAAGR